MSRFDASGSGSGWTSRVPSRQPYTGRVLPADYIVKNLELIGQINPYTEELMKKQHGRYLSGFGGDDPTGAVGIDPSYQGREIQKLEQQDDVYGSGIFDPPGTPGTANAHAGVFASHYSLPGYLGREIPFAVSQDVTDITDNADVVYVPGGGMSFAEVAGKIRAPEVLGPTPRPPPLQPSPPGGRMQVYAPRAGQQPQPALNPSAPQRLPATYRPARNNKYYFRAVPEQPAMRLMPTSPAEQLVPRASDVYPRDAQIAIRGFGQDEQPKSSVTPGQMVFAGLLVGVGAGLLVNVLSGS